MDLAFRNPTRPGRSARDWHDLRSRVTEVSDTRVRSGRTQQLISSLQMARPIQVPRLRQPRTRQAQTTLRRPPLPPGRAIPHYVDRLRPQRGPYRWWHAVAMERAWQPRKPQTHLHRSRDLRLHAIRWIQRYQVSLLSNVVSKEP
jgi:hypothetical protein